MYDSVGDVFSPFFSVKQIQGDLGSQIQSDFEEAFQGAGAKVGVIFENHFNSRNISLIFYST